MTSDNDARKAATEEIRVAAGKYRRAKQRTDELQVKLIETMRAAYAIKVSKADIIRASGHIWTRQWIDQTLGTKPKTGS